LVFVFCLLPALPVWAQPPGGGWHDDILTGFWAKTLTLDPDYDGPVTATLVRRTYTGPKDCAVLYIHGYVDYFLQPLLAKFYEETLLQTTGRSCHFFALDLRKYGRSLPVHYPHPNYARKVEEYYEEIDLALQAIHDDGYPWIMLNGHSTGALVAARYLQDGEHRAWVNALFLNSPFLDFNGSHTSKLGTAVSSFVSLFCRYCKSDSPVSRWYARSLHKKVPVTCGDCEGQWEFKLRLKPLDGFKVYYAWVRAIARAQGRAKRGGITQPILVLHSTRSNAAKTPDWRWEYRRQDLVLDVEDMKRDGPKLGGNVQVHPIEGGVHDLAMSDDDARRRTFDEVTQWLRSLPGSPFPPPSP
jgi:alpha-beta hydrolase superfamily lysophospholipase